MSLTLAPTKGTSKGQASKGHLQRALPINKAITAKHGDEQETIDAFVALGGNHEGLLRHNGPPVWCWLQADRSGTISTDRLQAVVRPWNIAALLLCSFCVAQEFELTLNIAKFIAEVDKENSGTIGYEPFKLLLA
ncbi:hypothetical protein QJQ45_026022 [Haematococcus lacustris]|nr:hypothetical protein QJQ45_026022 [Haematococcus lacustris]